MPDSYFEDKVYDTVDFSVVVFINGGYEACSFINCNLNAAVLDQAQFIDCVFRDCDLSMAKIGMTVFNGVTFENCKMLGLNFENASEFLFLPVFKNSVLNFSSFYKRNLKKAIFSQCSLQEVDFTGADLAGVTLDQCDLVGAKFESTILEKADLRTAYNYVIDPEKNRVKKAKFAAGGLPGLLTKYDIEIG